MVIRRAAHNFSIQRRMMNQRLSRWKLDELSWQWGARMTLPSEHRWIALALTPSKTGFWQDLFVLGS